MMDKTSYSIEGTLTWYWILQSEMSRIPYILLKQNNTESQFPFVLKHTTPELT